MTMTVAMFLGLWLGWLVGALKKRRVKQNDY